MPHTVHTPVARLTALDGGWSETPERARLADDLGIAPNTVARSYRELERDGVVETRGRNGTFVAGRDT